MWRFFTSGGAQKITENAGSPIVRVRHATNQSVAAGGTTLAWDTEDLDTDTMHDPVTNNSRLTAKTGGTYLILANLVLDSSFASGDNFELRLNGASTLDLIDADASGLNVKLETIYALAQNDYVEIRAFNGTGGARNVVAVGSHFEAVKVN